MAEVVPLRVDGDRVEALDQTLLPHETRYFEMDGLATTCEAIRSLRVRGAPLLGLVGAYGLYVAGRERGVDEGSLRDAAVALSGTRPTAADLGARVGQSLASALAVPEPERLPLLRESADRLARDRVAEDLAMARFGVPLLGEGIAVLTHCNAGALATGGIGTALGVVRVGWEQGQVRACYATETRPLLQGARLTAWELKMLGIPSRLVPDTAAAALIASREIGAVVVGADRIARNGDAANKIGTYGLALAAKRAGVPFYVVAPTSTVDLGCEDGSAIPIEFRAEDEVGGFGGVRWAPDGVGSYNPAFDVTPADLITAIVTERGVARPPFDDELTSLCAR
ncbi:MAG TPA: S-methyl-5-thioribose-1-phosphate isomerase [Tepidiformaceae bacterium]|nr:S-methyl-5-thioribose-1-phosphate isomerase [Tepidiformaceae bacterium]